MIKVNPDGSFEAATPAEAVEISRLLTANKAANNTLAAKITNRTSTKHAPTPSLTPEMSMEIAGSVSDWVIPCAFRFLTAMQGAGTAGIDATVAMKAMEIDRAQAFGGRVAAVNKLLERCGFSVSQVYEASKNPQGKFWKGKSKLSDALNIIKVMKVL